MPKNVMCKKCNNYRNQWCEMVIDSPDPDIVRDCRHFWLKTNADRIRAMDDELLATQLTQVFHEGVTALTEEEIPDNLLNEVRAQILKKLKQPAEGE